MAHRSITRSLELALAPEAAFALLVTPSAIRSWWSASSAIVIPREGGLWCATWGEREDDPDYSGAARIRVFEPPRRLLLADYLYHAKSGGLPFAADLTTEFRIEPSGAGSRLTVTQAGFPAQPIADAFYAACEVGWENTLDALARFAAGRA